jgi:FtsP/CotA-like multicopper oxidase with cupredoxin domain
MMRSYTAALLAACASLVSAGPCKPRDECSFDSATSPECWGQWNLTTDWYATGPDTGVVREYWWEIVEHDISPDGIPRPALTINGTFPGPTIEADWGDTIVVHVINSAVLNGTSIHWHGIRQNYTNADDGVASITQCPSPPGSTVTYRWKATQYGSSWYHSHFSLQAWNGVVGMMTIHGPASHPYDVDAGHVALSDWYHDGVDALWMEAQTTGAPEVPNNLINGLNVFKNPKTNVTTGERWETTFEAGKSYRLRFVNTAIDSHYQVSLDGHTMTVIAADFVPIKPYTTNVLSIGIGQRYDVVIEANQQTEGDFWLRSVPQKACSAAHTYPDNMRAIIRYDASSTADPTSEPWTFPLDNCDDERASNLVPVLHLDAGQKDKYESLTLGLTTINGHFRWTLNENTFLSDWGYPTVSQVIEGNTTAYEATQQVIEIPEADKWFYLVIENPINLAHPIHLHGHDFYILAQTTGTFDVTNTSALNLVNPMRRDVAMLPGSGYLVLGFYTDNPGVWLAHCHIGWHTSEGLALQFVERADEIAALYEHGVSTGMDLQDVCEEWNAWEIENSIHQEDSGV